MKTKAIMFAAIATEGADFAGYLYFSGNRVLGDGYFR